MCRSFHEADQIACGPVRLTRGPAQRSPLTVQQFAHGLGRHADVIDSDVPFRSSVCTQDALGDLLPNVLIDAVSEGVVRESPRKSFRPFDLERFGEARPGRLLHLRHEAPVGNPIDDRVEIDFALEIVAVAVRPNPFGPDDEGMELEGHTAHLQTYRSRPVVAEDDLEAFAS